MVVLTLHDSPFYSLLSIFSLIFLFILLFFTFFIHVGGTILSQVMSPTTSTCDIFIQESSGDNRSLNLHDLEFDDYTIGMALSSPLFTQERDYPASRRQACHSLGESLSSSQSSSVGHVRTGRPVNEFGSLSLSVIENPCRDSENEQIRILLERQQERILADCRAEIQKH